MGPLPAFAADTGLRGFNIQHFHEPSDLSGIHTLYGTRTLGHLKPALRLAVNSAKGLARVRNDIGNDFNVVGTTIIGDVSAAIGLGRCVDVGVIAPLVLYEDELDVNTLVRSRGGGVGDLLLDAKFRLMEDRQKRVGLGLVSRMSLPTGDEQQFTGWGKPTGEFRLVLDKAIGPIYAVANAGLRIAPKINVVNASSGVPWNFTEDDRLTFGAGLQYSLPLQRRSWDIQASIYGENVLGHANELSTPLEMGSGIMKRFANGMAVGAGGGFGLTSALGSPSYRAFASVAFNAGRREKGAPGRAPPGEEAAPVRKTILFSFDDWAISKGSRGILEGLAADLKGRDGITVSIVGHTDSTGRASYNRRLGLRRAKAVADFLSSLGVEGRLLEVSSRGESSSADSNLMREGRQKNRRVEIEVDVSP